MNPLPPDATSPDPEPGHRPPETGPTRPARPRWRKPIMRIARSLAAVYLGFAAVMFSIQARIIFPGHETQGQPFAEVRPRPGTELVRLTTRQGVPIVALYGPAMTADG